MKTRKKTTHKVLGMITSLLLCAPALYAVDLRWGGHSASESGNQLVAFGDVCSNGGYNDRPCQSDADCCYHKCVIATDANGITEGRCSGTDILK